MAFKFGIGLAFGAVALLALYALVRATEEPAARPLPRIELRTLAGERVPSARLPDGRPVVVNLWASWCAPCRREMPVLAAAARRSRDVRFVFANQGEAPEAARAFAERAGLDPATVLLDPGAHFGLASGSPGLPTTLFYDAGGLLVDSHTGELTAASLATRLERLRGARGASPSGQR